MQLWLLERQLPVAQRSNLFPVSSRGRYFSRILGINIFSVMGPSFAYVVVVSNRLAHRE